MKYTSVESLREKPVHVFRMSWFFIRPKALSRFSQNSGLARSFTRRDRFAKFKHYCLRKWRANDEM